MMIAQAEQMEEFVRANPEFAGDLEGVEMFDAEQLKMLRELDFEDFRRYIGPSSWEMESTDNGFVLRSYLLTAAEE
jgi:hypothetical protein